MRGAGNPRSICWDCAKACGGCSWSRKFKPVQGWEAVPTHVTSHNSVYSSSYAVLSCPMFERDATEYGLKWFNKSKGSAK